MSREARRPARRTAALFATIACTIAASGCGGTRIELTSATAAITATAGGTPAQETPQPNGPPSHPEPPYVAPSASHAIDTRKAIGQLLMSHVSGLVASPALLSRIRAGMVGSVILYRENIASNQQLSSLTSSLQQAAKAGGNPPLFIGTDQEGGPVKRLYHAPPSMSARQMGASGAPRAVAEAQGLATARQLRALGINLDFAPVSDIPTSADNFLGERAFGRTVHPVVEGATGFAVGLARGRIAASAKHFPGLGAAGPLDSDFSIVSIGSSAAALRAAYAPYRAMSEAGPTVAPLVMISDAAYPALDASGVPAVLSRPIVHDELAAAGMASRVTITDDLEVPLVRRYRSAAVAAILAGEDILMFAERESGSERAYGQIAAALAAGTIPRATMLAAAAKVMSLKQALDIGHR